MDHNEDRLRHTAEKAVRRDGNRSLGRRAALARLGLIAGAAYVAPTLALLQGAKAQGGPSGPKWNKPTKPTKPSRPSGPSR